MKEQTQRAFPIPSSSNWAEWKERKIEAFKMHTTQHGVLERVRDFIDKHMNDERYLLAATRNPRPLAEDEALFANVIED